MYKYIYIYSNLYKKSIMPLKKKLKNLKSVKSNFRIKKKSANYYAFEHYYPSYMDEGVLEFENLGQQLAKPSTPIYCFYLSSNSPYKINK